MAPERGRVGQLQQVPVREDGDPIGDGEGFVLVVGDVERGACRSRAGSRQYPDQVLPKPSIEGGERFVQEQQLRFRGQGAGQRHPLRLST